MILNIFLLIELSEYGMSIKEKTILIEFHIRFLLNVAMWSLLRFNQTTATIRPTLDTAGKQFVSFQMISGMDDDAPRAFNLYRNKKLISHGMMNVALFSANANQLRYVFDTGDGGAVYVICIVLLLISIFLQVRTSAARKI